MPHQAPNLELAQAIKDQDYQILPKIEPFIKQDPDASQSSICNEELDMLKLLLEKQGESSLKKQRLPPIPLQENDFQCCVCSLSFNKKIVLVLHLRTVHSMNQGEAREIVEEQLREEQPTDNHSSHVEGPMKQSEIGTRNLPILSDIEPNESKLNLLKEEKVFNVGKSALKSADNYTLESKNKVKGNPIPQTSEKTKAL